MRNYMQFLNPQILCFLFFSALLLCLVETKSTIEPCNSSNSCPSLLSYLLPWDSKLSEIATRFNVNFSDILASNSIFPITPSSAHQILSAKSLVKIPISCSCVEGYGGLVSAEQIKIVNRHMEAPLLFHCHAHVLIM